MGQEAELEAVLTRMTADFLSRNYAGRLVQESLDAVGVGFVPVIDHVTIRTMDIDLRAQEFVSLATPTMRLCSMTTGMPRCIGGPDSLPSSSIRPIRMSVGRPVLFPVGCRSSATSCSTTWRFGWKTSSRRSIA
ncbi:MAG: hypothetical protein UZ03_NOB001003438 [Nitrospira sp. OLB3]|nr:MAG: hypothetical protein UZ03_NOB001003438 [Nitrospira sp. OLB3]